MSSPLTVIYEFDRFRLDRGNQRLTRDGLLLSMPGKTLPLLLELIENRENVVSSEKLVNSIFPKSPFGEEELITEVLKLKRLLDDTSKQAPVIRMILGSGYRFEAEVTEYLGDSGSDQQFGNKATESESTASYSSTATPAKERGSKIGIAVAVVLMAAVGFGVWRFMPMHSSGGSGSFSSNSGTSGTPQVAILPFQSLTGAANDDTFNRNLTDALMKSVAKQSQIEVVPAASVQHYLASGVSDPVTAGRELGATLIVRGMAQRLAGRIVVKVQLISTDDGSQIWSTGFEGDAGDLQTLTNKISEKIGKGIPGTETAEQQ